MKGNTYLNPLISKPVKVLVNRKHKKLRASFGGKMVFLEFPYPVGYLCLYAYWHLLSAVYVLVQ